MAWHPLLPETELPEGAMRAAEAAGVRLVLCRHRGRVHAFEDRCPHANGPLTGGNFADGRLICPWHAWEFLCETGALDFNPAIVLRRFPVRCQDGMILVDA
ncbi:MAG: Rieske (2Fe-2S) protein [Bryobacteraceae bacterium]|nr:Rieske (2Fe-2S) protein [Bryobacteraceae bacterium]MCX7604145.1 Rieske (2Fe-2S) protein [Bryobacteraceae bacterium]